MIRICIPKTSARHEYIFRVIFDLILGTGYRIVEFSGSQNQPDSTLPDISYGVPDIPGSLCIPDCGLLSDTGISRQELNYQEGELPHIFHIPGNFDLDFDLFSASFYLITEYEKYDEPVFDKHGRYLESHYETFQRGLYKEPLIHHYANLLWDKLHQKFPLIERKTNPFDFRITIDVDAPWLFLNKGIRTYLGFLKDIALADWINMRKRFQAIRNGQDPFDTFDELTELADPVKTIFFFLIDGSSNFDPGFGYRNKAYRKLIRSLAKKGYCTGIHPSYFSFTNENMIRKETNELKKITGNNITLSRMHYLKYRLPDTCNFLIYSGILDEFTACMVSDTGFKNCMAIPFPWFDLEENRETGLIIHPVMIMDAALKDYLKFSPETALERMKEVIDKTYRVGGEFVLIWHNSNYTDFDHGTPWKKVFNESLDYLKQLCTK